LPQRRPTAGPVDPRFHGGAVRPRLRRGSATYR
jgi:hypothetical protein